jgi:ATP/maltotriose-dependent transcriptional regulator MalT
MRQEALYCRAKAYLNRNENGLAVVDLVPLSQEAVTAIGAESKYLLAQAYYNLGALDNAEAEVMAFAQMNTQHQYWLAKAMVLLADISLKREDTYQAQQYLLALQANYHAEDDIQGIIAERLAAINAMMQAEQADDDDDTEPIE